MKALPLLGLMALLAAPALAGGYELFVANDRSASCLTPAALAGDPGHPVHGSAEVAADVLRYFRGEETKIPLFAPAFRNAHVVFCGEAERREVYEAFVTASRFPHLANESHLYDFARMLGGRQLVELAERALEDYPPDSPVRQRLERVVRETESGMRARGARYRPPASREDAHSAGPTGQFTHFERSFEKSH